jgi:tyrosine-protein phosphatase YwqE
MVHFFGTDSHNNSVYNMQEKALKKIKKTIKDEELIEKIFVENPQKVLNNEKISIWYPKSK